MTQNISLHEMMDEPESISGRWEDRNDSGSCCFCRFDNSYKKVFVVSGQRTQTRFCKNCLDKVKNMSK